MHVFDSKFSHFLHEQRTCVRLEACAACGELDDLACSESLEEDARRSYTILACIQEHRSDTNCLYLDGPPLALLKEHTKKLQISHTHPLRDLIGYVTLPSKPCIERDVGGGYFIRLASEYLYYGDQSNEILSSVDIKGKRLDIDTSTIKWRLNDQIRCIEQFCARKSMPAVLLVDETMSPQEFKALNRDETCPDEIRNQIVENFKLERSLNVAQTYAVDHAMCHHITCIQGPPGTGKTRVAAAIAFAMHQLQKQSSQRQRFTFITAPTNQAVDNFEDKISEILPGKVLRWGDLEKQKHRAKEKGLKIKVDHWVRDRSIRLRMNCLAVIEQARGSFISGTCNSFAGRTLDHDHFLAARIIVDESGQAAPWEYLAPCAKAENQGAVTFIGDQNQLPPCLKSFEAQRRGGHVSILEKCFRNPAHEKIVLEAQFRMHPDLLSYLNKISYSNQLYSTMMALQQEMPSTFPTGNQERLVFINGQGPETRKGHSYYNDDEAKNIIDCVRTLLSSGEIRGQDITVLAAYSAQVTILRSGLQDQQIFEGVQVCTLDGFQGRENKIIILSTVRNNELNSIGFLSSPQRITVAFSRAKTAMLVFGNAETLLCDDREGVWMTLFESFKAYDTKYHAIKIDCNPRVRYPKRSDPPHQERKCLKKARIDNSQWSNVEETVEKVPPKLDRGRLLTEVVSTLHWVQNYLKMAKDLTDIRGFSDALDIVTRLKKNGNPGVWQTNGTFDGIFVNDTRKTLSHEGYAVFWGVSKLKDPTNLVYYAAFLALLTREGWQMSKLSELRDRFVQRKVPSAQMQKVRAAQSMSSGVLVDAGDYLECLLTICNAMDPNMVTKHSAEIPRSTSLSTEVWMNVRHQLDQLISATAKLLPVCFKLSQSKNYAFQSEFTLNVIRDVVCLEQNVCIFPEAFVKILEENHGRLRSAVQQ